MSQSLSKKSRLQSSNRIIRIIQALGNGNSLEKLASKNFHIQLRLNSNHTICLTKNNLCYVWGNNTYGQLGLAKKSIFQTPILLTLPNKERIAFIACGATHTIYLTENNQCYVSGENEFGELGINGRNTSLTPTLLEFNFDKERISFIICGSQYTLCLTENNLCYVWGRNNYGQLGLGDTTNRSKPTLLSLPNNERISFITCGSQYTLCLTENNLCYVWGNNEVGQLGLGDKKERLSPTLLALPNNESISFITGGSNHTICLTENNLCYVWGRNSFGQLGLGDRDDRLTPTLMALPNNERISFITCGSKHTICLNENNLCYVWGWNDFGQLGLGDRIDRSTPTLLSLPNNERIIFITGGSNHTICLTENNLCYVWGFNYYGQLGLGDTNDRFSPTLLPLFNL